MGCRRGSAVSLQFVERCNWSDVLSDDTAILQDGKKNTSTAPLTHSLHTYNTTTHTLHKSLIPNQKYDEMQAKRAAL